MVEGSRRMQAIRNVIPHSRPTLGPEEERAVAEVLQSGMIVQGHAVKRLEHDLCTYIGLSEGVAASSCTAALFLSLLALGVGEGDDVILPSYVCSAPLNSIRHAGATPRFADIDLRTYNMSVDSVKGKISRETKAMIVPHMFGHPADISSLLALADRHGIAVIEDCAQAIGAERGGKRVGSFGILSCFSFYATKMLTTGEGGMVLTNSKDLADRIRFFREYDTPTSATWDDRGSVDLSATRYNFKMTDIQAAIGIEQLKKLPLFVQKRREIAGRYSDALAGLPLMRPQSEEGKKSVFYRYTVRSPEPIDIRELLKRSREAGVCLGRPNYPPLHERFPGNTDELPNTEVAAKSAFSLPIYPSLTAMDIEVVLKQLTGRLAGM